MPTAAAAEDPVCDRTPRSVLVAYAMPSLTASLLFGAVSMYLLKFSTDVLLIPPATVGLIFGLSRLWDAVTDPVVGHLSDRTHTRLGRRRPWILASALPVGLAYVALWSPPESLSSVGLVAWLGGSVLLFYTAMTTFGVPYTALGAELSRGYHDRTRVFGVRAFADHAGIILSAAAILVLENSSDPRAAAAWLGVAAASAMGVGIVWPAIVLREPAGHRRRGGSGNPYKSFGDVLRNSHARILLGVFFLETLGFQALVTLLPYMTQYILESPGTTGHYLFGAIGSTLVTIPIWLPLSRRFGKAPVWTVTLGLKTVLFAWLFFIGAGETMQIMTITVAFGVLTGAGAVLGPSLKADVVDTDEARTGERKEGTFFSAWGLAMKSAVGCSILLSGTMLQWSGFQPNATQTTQTLTGMRLLISVLPVLLHCVAVILMLRFRLDASGHAKVRRQIDRDAFDRGAASPAGGVAVGVCATHE
jgi:GPH family glycoside/pentoside/hexuronide:cation symporter